LTQESFINRQGGHFRGRLSYIVMVVKVKRRIYGRPQTAKLSEPPRSQTTSLRTAQLAFYSRPSGRSCVLPLSAAIIPTE